MENWNFKVLNFIPLPKVNKYNNKYEALEILDFQLNKIKGDEIIIGLTYEDICTDTHNVKHYGIIGLSYRPGNVCIVSDKRVRINLTYGKSYYMNLCMHTMEQYIVQIMTLHVFW